MANTITTTIDAAGRVVVPKSIREAAGLVPGTRIEVRIEDGRVELEPMPLEVRIERRDGLVVAVPAEAADSRTAPPLTAADVRRARERLRRDEA